MKQNINNTYGIDVSNEKGLNTMLSLFKSTDPLVQSKVKKTSNFKEWTVKELQLLEQALQRYGPLLKVKEKKGDSTLPLHGLTSVSRAEQDAFQETSGAIGTKPYVGGNTYIKKGGKKDITMFDAAKSAGDFKDPNKDFRGTIEHELSHALIENLPAPAPAAGTSGGGASGGSAVSSTMIDFFSRSMPFWQGNIHNSPYWRNASNGPLNYNETRDAAAAAKIETPITDYGIISAQEDLAETMKYFFENPQKLKEKCRKRFDFVLNNLGDKLDREYIERIKLLL